MTPFHELWNEVVRELGGTFDMADPNEFAKRLMRFHQRAVEESRRDLIAVNARVNHMLAEVSIMARSYHEILRQRGISV